MPRIRLQQFSPLMVTLAPLTTRVQEQNISKQFDFMLSWRVNHAPFLFPSPKSISLVSPMRSKTFVTTRSSLNRPTSLLTPSIQLGDNESTLISEDNAIMLMGMISERKWVQWYEILSSQRTCKILHKSGQMIIS